MERGGTGLARFGNHPAALPKIERQLAGREDPVFHQYGSLAIDPAGLNGDGVVESSRFVGIGFGQNLFAVGDHAAGEHAVGARIAGNFKWRSLFDRLLDRFGQPNAQVVAERIVSDHRNVDRADVVAVERLISQLVARAAASGYQQADAAEPQDAGVIKQSVYRSHGNDYLSMLLGLPTMIGFAGSLSGNILCNQARRCGGVSGFPSIAVKRSRAVSA